MTLLDWGRPGRIKQLLDPTWCAGVEIVQDRGRNGHMNLHLKNPLIWLYDKNGPGQQEESTSLIRRREYLLNFGVINVNLSELIVAVHPTLILSGAAVTSPVKIDPPYSGALAISVHMGYGDLNLTELPWIISLSALG
jgi:hypothetical protein